MATEMSSEVVFSGILYKCGNKVKTWKKRWMALKDDCCLYYYKDVTMSRKPQGIVSLRDPKFSVRVGEREDCTWPKQSLLPNTLVLETSSRTYYMYALSTSVAEQWKKMLETIHSKQMEGTQNSDDNESMTERLRFCSEGGSLSEHPLSYVSIQGTEEETREKVHVNTCTVEVDEPDDYYELVLHHSQEKIEGGESDSDGDIQLALYEPIDGTVISEACFITARIPSPKDQPQQPLLSITRTSETASIIANDSGLSNTHERLLHEDMSRVLLHEDISEDGESVVIEKSNSEAPTASAPPLLPRNESENILPLPPNVDGCDPLIPMTDSPFSIPTKSVPVSVTGLFSNGHHSMSESGAVYQMSSSQELPASASSQLGNQYNIENYSETSEPGQQLSQNEDNSVTGEMTEQMQLPKEKGMLMFERQRHRTSEVLTDAEQRQAQSAQVCKDIAEVELEQTVSLTEKVVISETIREIELQRMQASEEQFRLERERKRLEDERRKFEEEKEKLWRDLQSAQIEMQNTHSSQ